MNYDQDPIWARKSFFAPSQTKKAIALAMGAWLITDIYVPIIQQ